MRVCMGAGVPAGESACACMERSVVCGMHARASECACPSDTHLLFALLYPLLLSIVGFLALCLPLPFVLVLRANKWRGDYQPAR